jgi:ubiquinone/menaquinone biosynthesis C-methylase UbiE
MNDDVLAMTQELSNFSGDFVATHERSSPAIPAYLEDTYWWAYLRPRSIWLFEREWLVNLILWGNMHRLTDAVLDEMDCKTHSAVLQVACVYGDFSNRLAAHLRNSGSRLHILDIAPIQLRNAGDKLEHHDNVSLHHQDSSKLEFTSGKFDQTVVFFLLHEQPQDVRRKTIAEAIRVTRPGGKVVFVDYHGPRRTNPLRYVMRPVLHWLEPFALDLWRTQLRHYLPEHIAPQQVSSTFYFGGLYQKVVITC